MSAIGASNAIVGAFEYLGGLSTITDDKGNNYNLSAVGSMPGDGNNMVVFYLPNIPAGGPTILTATWDTTVQFSFCRFVITEFSGVLAASPLDVGFGGPTLNQSVVGAAAFSTAAVVTLADGDLIYAAACQTNASTGVALGAGFTPLIYGANGDVVPMRAEYKVQSAHGSVTGAFAGVSGTNNYLSGMIPLKAAPAAGGGTTTYHWNLGVNI